MLPTSRGRLFNVPIESSAGHSRTYYSDGILSIAQPINAWLQAIGLFLAVLGRIGLLLQKRII